MRAPLRKAHTNRADERPLTTFPSSVHEKYLGIVQLARTIDKAKMVANGTIGEYHYDCSMDQALFTEFGIDAKKLSAVRLGLGEERQPQREHRGRT